jgi:hypothetical protein
VYDVGKVGKIVDFLIKITIEEKRKLNRRTGNDEYRTGYVEQTNKE